MQMFSDATREKLQHIVRGAVIEAASDHCTATRNFLCSGFSTSRTVKVDFESQLIIKEEQAQRLKAYAFDQNLWVQDAPRQSQCLTKGGESKVYLDRDHHHVIENVLMNSNTLFFIDTVFYTVAVQ